MKKKQVFEAARNLTQRKFRDYKEKLRSVNPPCVPFVGQYMTTVGTTLSISLYSFYRNVFISFNFY